MFTQLYIADFIVISVEYNIGLDTRPIFAQPLRQPGLIADAQRKRGKSSRERHVSPPIDQ